MPELPEAEIVARRAQGAQQAPRDHRASPSRPAAPRPSPRRKPRRRSSKRTCRRSSDAAALEATIRAIAGELGGDPDRPDHGRAAQTPRRPVRRQARQRADQEALRLAHSRSCRPGIVRPAPSGRSCRMRPGMTPGRPCTSGRRSSARCGWCRHRGSNHSWHVPLYVTVRGLTTSPIPYGGRTLEIDFDLIAHRLVLRTDDGARARCSRWPRSRSPPSTPR